ncbi:hypothetical protein ACRN9Z_16600 [Shewanella frigidimarina]|jgi:hypothetical protein|uniref:hypothetical protein n=1 Tax=Shewanella frigidimarina TaxID=56812 RepID=UPI003D7A6D01
MVLLQLKTLKPTLGTSFNSRVKFIVLCLTHQLTTAVIRYEYYDSHGIGERDFDTAFEMNDATEVTREVIRRLGSSAESIIDRELGQGTYQHWLDIDPQKSMF